MLTNDWAMQCPACGDVESLDIVARVAVRLCADGTDADGNHEWDSDSPASCGCGWSGKVAALELAAVPLAFRPLPPAPALALEFARLLRLAMNDSEWAAMCRINDAAPLGVCGSHNFHDSNMTMAAAWLAFGFSESDTLGIMRTDGGAALWGDAWNLAKRRYLTTRGADPAGDGMAREFTARERAAIMVALKCYQQSGQVGDYRLACDAGVEGFRPLAAHELDSLLAQWGAGL